MNSSNPESNNSKFVIGFDSRDSEILIVDGPGDAIVRPPRPLLLKLGLAERERIEKWEKLKKEGNPPTKPEDGAGPKKTSE